MINVVSLKCVTPFISTSTSRISCCFHAVGYCIVCEMVEGALRAGKWQLAMAARDRMSALMQCTGKVKGTFINYVHGIGGVP